MEHSNKNRPSDGTQRKLSLPTPGLHPEHGTKPGVNNKILEKIILLEIDRFEQRLAEAEAEAKEIVPEKELEKLVSEWTRYEAQRPFLIAIIDQAISDQQFFAILAYIFTFVKKAILYIYSGPSTAFYVLIGKDIETLVYNARIEYAKFVDELGRGRATSVLGRVRAEFFYCLHWAYKAGGARSVLAHTLDVSRFLLFFSPIQVYTVAIIQITHHQIQQATLPQVLSPQRHLVAVLRDSSEEQLMLVNDDLDDTPQRVEDELPPLVEITLDNNMEDDNWAEGTSEEEYAIDTDDEEGESDEDEDWDNESGEDEDWDDEYGEDEDWDDEEDDEDDDDEDDGDDDQEEGDEEEDDEEEDDEGDDDEGDDEGRNAGGTEESNAVVTKEEEKKIPATSIYDIFPDEVPLEATKIAYYGECHDDETADTLGEDPPIPPTEDEFGEDFLEMHPDEVWTLAPATEKNYTQSFRDKVGQVADKVESNFSLRDVDSNWDEISPEFIAGKWPDNDDDDGEEISLLFRSLDTMIFDVNDETRSFRVQKVNQRLALKYECELTQAEIDDPELVDHTEDEDSEEVEYPEADIEDIWLTADDVHTRKNKQVTGPLQKTGAVLNRKWDKRRTQYCHKPAPNDLAIIDRPAYGLYGNKVYSGISPGQWFQKLELPLYATEGKPYLFDPEGPIPRAHELTMCDDELVTKSFAMNLAFEEFYEEEDDDQNGFDDSYYYDEDDDDEDGDDVGVAYADDEDDLDTGDDEDDLDTGDGEDDRDTGDGDDDEDGAYDEDDEDDLDTGDGEDDDDEDGDAEGSEDEDGGDDVGVNYDDDAAGNNKNVESAESEKAIKQPYNKLRSAFSANDQEWYEDESELELSLDDLAALRASESDVFDSADSFAHSMVVFSDATSMDPIMRFWSPCVVSSLTSVVLISVWWLKRMRLSRRRHGSHGSHKRENVSRKIIHVSRVPNYVPLAKLPGNYTNNVNIRKLLNAFEANRGKQFYRPNFVMAWWENHVLAYLSYLPPDVQEWLYQPPKVTNISASSSPTVPPIGSLTAKTPAYVNFAKVENDLPIPRISLSQDLKTWQKNTLQHWWMTTGQQTDTVQLAEKWENRFIRCINTVGYLTPLAAMYRVVRSVEHEVRSFMPIASFYQGPDQLEKLPRGLLVSGPAGNGRELFVRALAGDARVPLFMTESNRFTDEKYGLVRLMAAFLHARNEAPSILFLRDIDHITYDREKNRSWRSLRMTTQFLLILDGYRAGSDKILSHCRTFVVGSVATTATLDPACLRFGRFEWLLEFNQPALKERRIMLKQFVSVSAFPTSTGFLWDEVALATKGFSLKELRCLLNSTVLQQTYRRQSETYTMSNLHHAIGTNNLLRDRRTYYPESSESQSTKLQSFFEWRALNSRDSSLAKDTASADLLQLLMDGTYVEKKILQCLRLIVGQPERATRVATSWARWVSNPPQSLASGGCIEMHQQGLFVDGVLNLLAEMLFLRDFMGVTCSPLMTFDTYTHSLGAQIQSVYLPMHERQILARSISTGTFIRQFNIWEQNQPVGWASLSHRPLRQLTARFYWLNDWQMKRKFHFKPERHPYPRAKRFSLPMLSPALESVKATPRDIRNQYEEEGELIHVGKTISLMMQTRLRENMSIGFMRRPKRTFLRDQYMFGTFGTTHFFAQKEWKKVVRIKQVAHELLKLGQLTD